MNYYQRRWRMLAILSLMTMGSQIAGCSKREKEEKAATLSADTTSSIRVVTTTVEPRIFEDWGTYSSDLRGADDVVLTAPIPGGGRVDQVAEVGKMVTKGQGLCKIESDKYQAMLMQAQSALDLAKGEFDRVKVNVEKGYVGKAMVDKANFDFQSARVAHLQSLRAYEDSRCQAPFAGIMVSRFVERFQGVGPGAPTVRIAGISRLEAVISIPEAEAFEYKEGQKAEFLMLQGEANPISGRIRGLDRAVETHSRTVTARIELPNPGTKLRPGMVGKVRILRKRYDQALVLPSQAVLRLQEGTVVMRINGDRAEKVAVALGAAQKDSVLVLTGLSAGDRIITVGAFQVSEGTKVEF